MPRSKIHGPGIICRRTTPSPSGRGPGRGLLVGYYPICVGAGARSAAINPQPLCEPSQNGLFFDCAQRHKATAGLSAAMKNLLPAASTMVIGPSTKNGPLSRTLMVTSDMLIFLKNSKAKNCIHSPRSAVAVAGNLSGMAASTIARRTIGNQASAIHSRSP